MSAFKTEWLAALRSGEYEQVRGLLYCRPLLGPEGFCCLGVAAETSGHLNKNTGRATGHVAVGSPGLFLYFGPGNELQAGPYPCPHEHDRHTGSLVDLCAHLNDVAKWNFNMIADWLETIDF